MKAGFDVPQSTIKARWGEQIMNVDLFSHLDDDCEFVVRPVNEWNKDTTLNRVSCRNRAIQVKAFAESLFPELHIDARELLSANIFLIEAVASSLCIGASGLPSGFGRDVYDKITAVVSKGTSEIKVHSLNRSYNNGSTAEISIRPTEWTKLLETAEQLPIDVPSVVKNVLLTSDRRSLAVRKRRKPLMLGVYLLVMFGLSLAASLPGDGKWHEKMYDFLQLFFTIAISFAVGVFGLVQEYDSFLNIYLGLARVDDLAELDCNLSDLLYTIHSRPEMALALDNVNTSWKIWGGGGGGRTTSSLVVRLYDCTQLSLTIDKEGKVALRFEHPGTRIDEEQYHQVSYDRGMLHVEGALADFHPILRFTTKARIE